MNVVKSILLALMLSVAGAQAATVYATVNGEKITDEDIESLLKQMPNAPEFDKLSPEIQKKVIKQMVDRKLLIQNALKEGIEKNAEYKKALEKLKENLALEVWMQEAMQKITVTDKEAQDFYKENLQNLTEGAKVKASHILLKTEDEAKKVIKELKGLKGEKLASTFAEKARTSSTGPSASKGGDLGWFEQGQMVKPFSDAAFKLEKGSMTMEPVQTSFGYHVIYVADKKEASTVPFSEVEEQMVNGAKMEKFRTMVESKVEGLSKNAKIEYK